MSNIALSTALPGNRAITYTPVDSAEARRGGGTKADTVVGIIESRTPIPTAHRHTPTRVDQNPSRRARRVYAAATKVSETSIPIAGRSDRQANTADPIRLIAAGDA